MMFNGTGLNGKLIMEVGHQVITSPFLYFLLAAMLLEFITGIGKALLTGTYSSRIGTDGVIKHSMVLLLAIFVAFFFRLFGIAPVGQIIKSVLAFNYIVSIMENMDAAGIYIPQSIKDLFLQMRDNAEDKLTGESIQVKISKLPEDPVLNKTKKGVDR